MKTLLELLDDYLSSLKSLNYSPVTLKNYRSRLQQFISFLAEECHVLTPNVILTMHLEKWQKHLTDQKNPDGLPLKAVTLNKKISDTKGFLRFLAERGFVLASLIDHLKSLRAPKTLPGKTYSHRRLKNMLAKIDITTPKGYRDRTILELMYSSGLRGTELTTLNVHDIDFTAATALILGKGQKERLVPIGKTALHFLENYLKNVRARLLQATETQALFLGGKGDRISYDILLAKVVNRHCIDPQTGETPGTHVFRRSCATEMIKGNANLYHVKEILGHESLETVKHYTKLTITDLHKTHQKTHPRA